MYFLLPLLLLLFIPALINAWREFNKAELTAKIESSMPDVLLVLSSLPASTPFEKLIATAAQVNAPAAVHFKKCAGLISKGAPVETAVLHPFSSTSMVISKTGELISKLYSNGNSTLKLINRFALQLGEYNKAKQSVKADSAMQKYSLLISCALLVPLVIGLMYKTSRHASELLGSEAGMPSDIVLLSINIYLLALSIIVSKFLAEQFSTHFLKFFSATAPLSLLVFNASLLLAS